MHSHSQEKLVQMLPHGHRNVNRREPPMRIVARHWQTEQAISLRMEDGLVTSYGPIASRADLPWLAPSFCDLQVNGGLGIGFNDPDLTTDDVRRVANECRRRGCGQFLATVITDSPEAIESAFRTLAAARDSNPAMAALIPGFHLEGPFISPLDGFRGAHPAEQVRDPNWDLFARWQDAAAGKIRLVTLAPERPGAIPFIERLTAAGIVVAIGHTSADRDTITAAADAGAQLCTHLGNGLPALLPRHDNPIWPQLIEDRLWASLIADGHHLPASVLQVFTRLKTTDRLVLVSDASPLAGLPPGRYSLWGRDCEVSADGRVGLHGTPYLAGSGAFLDTCVAGAVRLGERSLDDAVTMASVRPRELLGLPVPVLELGRPIDVVLFDLSPVGLTVRETLGGMC